jgi:hypothetical protein
MDLEPPWSKAFAHTCQVSQASCNSPTPHCIYLSIYLTMYKIYADTDKSGSRLRHTCEYAQTHMLVPSDTRASTLRHTVFICFFWQ